MEENYQGYNQPEYENDDPRKGANKSILGYRIVIIILAVILAAITVLYYNIHRQQQADYDLLVIDRDSIQNNLSDLMQDFDDLQLSNDTLSLQMGIERQRADSLMQRLKQERSWSLAKIKQYEKEVGTLRTIMRGYLHQIDSLNTLNKKLIDENVSYRKEITTAQMRAEMAEEKAQELNNKVRQGSVINARGIRMVALNARSKEVSRIKNAERLRVDFTLTANALATPGEKTIYVRILSPDGYVLSSESVPTFEFEGERLSYSASRDVDYQNEDLNIGIFYTGSGFTAGTYQVQIYCDGFLIGSIELPMREILNLRCYHTDTKEAQGTSLILHHLPTRATLLRLDDLVTAMQIIRDRKGPLLFHCWHGSDRTGAVAAMYRMVFQHVPKQHAIDEMVEGIFGFHMIFDNIIDTIDEADIEHIRQELF